MDGNRSKYDINIYINYNDFLLNNIKILLIIHLLYNDNNNIITKYI